MSTLSKKPDRGKIRDLRVLANFIHIYCRENHLDAAKEPFAGNDDLMQAALGKKRILLCRECRRLLRHVTAKLLMCPYDPKPMCKKCETRCYAPGYREKIREVMRFSGRHLIRRGRVDLILKFFR